MQGLPIHSRLFTTPYSMHVYVCRYVAMCVWKVSELGAAGGERSEPPCLYILMIDGSLVTHYDIIGVWLVAAGTIIITKIDYGNELWP